MSLTSHLATPASPVTRFVEFAAPLVAPGNRQGPLGNALDGLLGLQTIPRSLVIPPVSGANPGTVGAAIDYRLRYHLAPCASHDFVAHHAKLLLGRRGSGVERQLDWCFANLDEVAASLAPAGKRLGDDDEALLARYCVVLAALEAVYRSDWTPPVPPAHRPRSPYWGSPVMPLCTTS